MKGGWRADDENASNLVGKENRFLIQIEGKGVFTGVEDSTTRRGNWERWGVCLSWSSSWGGAGGEVEAIVTGSEDGFLEPGQWDGGGRNLSWRWLSTGQEG